MRIASLRVLLPCAALIVAACGGDGSLRSPDLPPPQLTGIGQVACSETSIAVGQTATCQVTGGCTFERVNEDGSTTQIIGVCPDDLTFNSSNPGVAPIGPDDGVLTGTTPGTTNITAGGGGQVSTPVTITVNNACGETLTVTPAAVTLISGANVGTSQAFTATLTLSNDTTVNVSTVGTTTWTSSNEDALTFAANVATAEPGVDAQTNVTVTATYTGNVCATSGTLTSTAAVTIRPASVIGSNGICLETIPPAAAFTGCRADTGACLTPTEQIELLVDQTRQLQIRGRFDNGEECNITADTTLAVDDTGVASVDDAAVITGVGAGETDLTATFGGQTATRAVAVVVNQVLGKNSFKVFSKQPLGNDEAITLAEADNQKFACVGANNLVVDGLGGRTPRGSLKAFALAATCDSNAVDDEGNCTAPVVDGDPGERSAEAFEAIALSHATNGVTNLPPASSEPGADPLDDGIVWTSVAGYWGSQGGELTCIEESSNPSGNVGDLFIEPRDLVLDGSGFPVEPPPPATPEDPELPLGALQPNGLVYSDAAVRVGFNCITATYTNPEDPMQQVTDGMTVLVLPATNDILLSGSNDGEQLCSTLAPLFGSGPLLGLVEVTNVLSAVTSGLSPLLEALDAVPIDSLVTELQAGLSLLTAPLIDALEPALIDPVLEPLVCEVTTAVNLLLGLLTGTTPDQECGEDPGEPAP